MIRVPGMSSRQCVRTISAHVSDVAGVHTLEVNLRMKTVRVTGTQDQAAVLEAIEAAGYDVAAFEPNHLPAHQENCDA